MLFRKKKPQNQAELPESSSARGTSESPRPADPGISGDIVAAITVAIAAASGLSPSAFRIASISSSEYGGGFNTPIWGRVERLTRTQA